MSRRVFILINVLLAGERFNANRLTLSYKIGRKTLRRWRRWWQALFAATGHWRLLQLRWMPPPGQAPILALLALSRRCDAVSSTIFGLLARLRPCPWPDCPPDRAAVIDGPLHW